MKKDKDDGTAMGFSIKELRTQPIEELRDRLSNTRQALYNLNTKAAMAGYGRKRHSTRPHQFKGYRRAIARTLFALTEHSQITETI